MPPTQDEVFMRRALALGRRGEGLTRPNPPVGAVLVASDGTKVSEGWHRGAGLRHAEAVAIDRAGPAARGATLYVTLEPCCTWGRTPPCADRIVEAGILRVVAGAIDPNPAHRGRGLRKLRRAGIDVVRGVLRADAEALVAPFGRWVQTGMPWLTLKMGATLDGRIADGVGTSRWITGPAARRRVQALRRAADAVMVGAATAIADDPALLPRPPGGRCPWRVIVDARGAVPETLRALNDAWAGSTIMATTAACPERVRDGWARKGARVWLCRGRDGGVSLRDLARRLGRLGVLHVLCEGGGRLAAGLLRADWCDIVEWFAAPRLLGGRGVPAVGDLPWRLRAAPQLHIEQVERLGADLHIRCRLRKRSP